MLSEAFRYHNQQLYCEGVPLSALAAEYGTPLYLYSAAQLDRNLLRLQKAFAPLGAVIHYSLKANANLQIIRRLHAAGLGMDAVSGGEIFRARQAGVPAAQIVFAGVGKTAHELRYALEEGVGWFNVESLGELQLLNQLAGEMGKQARVALRLNPEVQAQTHRYIATGHGGAKFGMPADLVADILATQGDYPHLTIEGLHVHIGSQLGTVEASVEAVQHAQALAAPYPGLRNLNIGGGFPVAYAATDEYPPPDAFAQALAPLLEGWQLKLEPGRSIVANAGVLLISVLYTKQQGGKQFVISDGSMTELIRPALYEALHPVLPVQQAGATGPVVVAGPVCETADILHPEAALPPMQAGDLLAVMVAGAYGFVMASNYNQRPRPAEVLVEGEGWHLIRRAESWEDLARLEYGLDE